MTSLRGDRLIQYSMLCTAHDIFHNNGNGVFGRVSHRWIYCHRIAAGKIVSEHNTESLRIADELLTRSPLGKVKIA